jgi:hypothetical protein
MEIFFILQREGGKMENENENAQNASKARISKQAQSAENKWMQLSQTVEWENLITSVWNN